MKTSKAFFFRLLTALLWLVEKCFDLTEPVNVVFRQVRAGGIILEGDFYFMELREGQKVTVTAGLTTKSGNPAAYEKGSASWESSDESVASVEVNPDNELEATVRGVDGSANDSAVITFRADGDPDAEEKRELVGTLDVVITQGEAFVVSLSAGTPSDDTGKEEAATEETAAEAEETVS